MPRWVLVCATADKTFLNFTGLSGSLLKIFSNFAFYLRDFRDKINSTD